MSISKAIDAFNALIVINNDRIEGYHAVAAEMNEPGLKQFFSELAQTSINCKNELVAEVQRMGGIPDEYSGATGKFFRAWIKIKAALGGEDVNRIIELCEREENVALDAYKKVLIQEVNEIKPAEQEILNAQYALLKKDYEKVKLIIVD